MDYFSAITTERARKIAEDLKNSGRTDDAKEIEEIIADAIKSVRYSSEAVSLSFVKLPGRLAFPFSQSS